KTSVCRVGARKALSDTLANACFITRTCPFERNHRPVRLGPSEDSATALVSPIAEVRTAVFPTGEPRRGSDPQQHCRQRSTEFHQEAGREDGRASEVPPRERHRHIDAS